ncbi:MAG: GGDEF domain-containing protein [Selenomonadaceae bacterium]|nr:GGDEF domain-containing protein [Selenomonadaceae bacterium]
MKRLPSHDLRPAALLLTLFCLVLTILPVSASRITRTTTASRVRIGVVRPDLTPELADALFAQQTAYLVELSKYADWDFDVIELAPEDIGDALLTGQIDLAMPTELHIADTEHFASSKPLALRDLIGLYCRPGDDRYTDADTDLAVLNGARIGVSASRPDLLGPFEKFCKDNDLSVTTVPFATDPESHAALAAGTVDLLLDAATSSDAQESFVLALDSMPMAIAGLRQNAGLLAIIDDANDALQVQSPRFAESAHQQFEDRTRRLVTHFTPAERELIESLPPLRVVLAQDDPYITLNREILTAVCDNAGLHLAFSTAANASEARSMVEDGEADLFLDIYTSASDTTGLYYTDPIYTQEYILVGRDGAVLPKKGAIATPVLQPSFLEAVRQQFPGWTVLPTPDEQHALAAVSNGHTNLALSSVISMQATRNLILYPNLVLVPSQNRVLIGTSVAISANEPRLLQSVFNKALLRLAPQEKESILLKHEIRTPPHFSLNYFLAFYPLQTGLAIGGVLLLLFGAFFLRSLMERRRLAAAQRAALENYKYQSEIDPLTGLYNKAAMRQMIGHFLLEPPAPGHCHAFFMMDLDHFKAANDLCGHSFGDEVLIGFAESLRTIVRSRDLIGRFGGDEFVLFLKNITRSAIPRIAADVNRAATTVDERERTTNAEAQKHPERPLITVSVGIAIAEGTHESYEEIFRKADQAVYYVKNNGRGFWTIYGEEKQKKE